MKRSDIAMLILIASVSVLVAYFIASATPLGTAVSEPKEVQTVDRIEVNSEIAPDTRVFNDNTINPTVRIEINAEASQNAGQ